MGLREQMDATFHEVQRQTLLAVTNLKAHVESGDSQRVRKAELALAGAYRRLQAYIVASVHVPGSPPCSEDLTVAMCLLDAYFTCAGDWALMLDYVRVKHGEALNVSRQIFGGASG